MAYNSKEELKSRARVKFSLIFFQNNEAKIVAHKINFSKVE